MPRYMNYGPRCMNYGPHADRGGGGKILCGKRYRDTNTWNVEPGYCLRGTLEGLVQYFDQKEWSPANDWCPECVEELLKRLEVDYPIHVLENSL